MVIGLEALWLDNDNKEINPTSRSEWGEWIAATRTRNYVLGDPLLDWLAMHGSPKGFVQDRDYPGYDVRTDFTQLIFAQGRLFEEAVMEQIESLAVVKRISSDPYAVRDLDVSIQTAQAMRDGA